MKKEPRVFLSHILESIQLIEEYTKRLTEGKFQTNRAIQDAVIRRLEIIGEAVKNISPAFKNQHPDIPWKQMAGMRDVLIHGYFSVDLSLTWKVIQQKLPSLKHQLLEILDHLDSK